MKALVAVKQVVDYNIRVHAKADGGALDVEQLRMSMNPFDEVALEEAVRQKEKGIIADIIAVSCGPKRCETVLRTALAMGADRALHLQTDLALEPLLVAKILAAVVKREKPHVVLLGKQAIDGDDSQVPQMLAGLLGWGQATFASKLDVGSEEALVEREIDGGSQSLKLALPCVISTDLRLNEPRYIKLPNIIAAKKKPLEILMLADLGIDANPTIETLSITEPPARNAGVILKSVAQLVEVIKKTMQVFP